jgi:hypothetical protein
MLPLPQGSHPLPVAFIVTQILQATIHVHAVVQPWCTWLLLDVTFVVVVFAGSLVQVVQTLPASSCCQLPQQQCGPCT